MAACPACGKELPGEFPFCPYCTTPLTERPSAPVLEERKIVSVLFCDLVGFTSASEAADPEDVRARLRPYHARVRDVIQGYGGTAASAASQSSRTRCSDRAAASSRSASQPPRCHSLKRGTCSRRWTMSRRSPRPRTSSQTQSQGPRSAEGSGQGPFRDDFPRQPESPLLKPRKESQ